MFDSSLYDKTYVRELMSPAPELLNLGESMEEVMKKFQKTGGFRAGGGGNRGYVRQRRRDGSGGAVSRPRTSFRFSLPGIRIFHPVRPRKAVGYWSACKKPRNP